MDNTLSIEYPEWYNRSNKKYCFNLFAVFYVQIIPFENSRKYTYFSHPCLCYSSACKNIHDKYTDVNDSPMQLLFTQKRMDFLQRIVVKEDFTDCVGCPKLMLRNTTGFWTKDDFHYMFEEHGDKLWTGFYNKKLTTILPYSIAFNLDPGCNLKCKTCRKEYIRHTHDISDEDIEEMVCMARQVNHIAVGGDGEFFISPNYKKLLAHDLTSNNSKLKKITLYTNGTLFNESNWNKINDNTKNLITEIKISIDAACEDTYKKVRDEHYWPILIKNMEFIRKLKERYGFKLFSTFTISKYNVEDVTKFYDFSDALGFDQILFSFAREIFHPEVGDDSSFVIPMDKRKDIMEYLINLQKEKTIDRVQVE